MVTFAQIDIPGHGGRPVPNTLIRQEGASDHLAIFLPGYGYRASMPALYYPQQVLLEAGADCLLVEYAYDRDPTLRSEGMASMVARLHADVEAALGAGLAQRSYGSVTLVGKSLGTVAMAGLLGAPALRKLRVDWIWLTPLLRDAALCDAIAHGRPRSLFVSGDADPHYHAEAMSRVTEATGGQNLVIPGADHSLETPGDLERSLDAMRELVGAVQQFVCA